MSGGLCPSKSTVYVGNLPYSLTNNDIHKLLEKYGRVVKVTIVKDKTTHKSTGVAFVLFLKKEDAHTCVRALSGTQLFGRTLKCNIAKDNGRAAEFIRRKIYKDKSRCYECGEYGHLSYYCPQNMLGDREPEKKKKKKRFHRSGTAEYGGEDEGSEEEADNEDEGEDPSLESLSAAIRYQQEKMEQEEQARMNSGHCNDSSSTCVKKKRFKKSEYFSDEEEEIDDT